MVDSGQGVVLYFCCFFGEQMGSCIGCMLSCLYLILFHSRCFIVWRSLPNKCNYHYVNYIGYLTALKTLENPLHPEIHGLETKTITKCGVLQVTPNTNIHQVLLVPQSKHNVISLRLLKSKGAIIKKRKPLPKINPPNP